MLSKQNKFRFFYTTLCTYHQSVTQWVGIIVGKITQFFYFKSSGHVHSLFHFFSKCCFFIAVIAHEVDSWKYCRRQISAVCQRFHVEDVSFQKVPVVGCRRLVQCQHTIRKCREHWRQNDTWLRRSWFLIIKLSSLRTIKYFYSLLSNWIAVIGYVKLFAVLCLLSSFSNRFAHSVIALCTDTVWNSRLREP